jgi:Mg-chelatase subunit ChlI
MCYQPKESVSKPLVQASPSRQAVTADLSKSFAAFSLQQQHREEQMRQQLELQQQHREEQMRQQHELQQQLKKEIFHSPRRQPPSQQRSLASSSATRSATSSPTKSKAWLATSVADADFEASFQPLGLSNSPAPLNQSFHRSFDETQLNTSLSLSHKGTPSKSPRQQLPAEAQWVESPAR